MRRVDDKWRVVMYALIAALVIIAFASRGCESCTSGNVSHGTATTTVTPERVTGSASDLPLMIEAPEHDPTPAARVTSAANGAHAPSRTTPDTTHKTSIAEFLADTSKKSDEHREISRLLMLTEALRDSLRRMRVRLTWAVDTVTAERDTVRIECEQTTRSITWDVRPHTITLPSERFALVAGLGAMVTTDGRILPGAGIMLGFTLAKF